MSNLVERGSLPVGILNKGSTWALLVHHPPALESSEPLPICASNKHFSSLLPTSLHMHIRTEHGKQQYDSLDKTPAT